MISARIGFLLLASMAAPYAAIAQTDETPAYEQQTECGLLSGFASGYYEEADPDRAKLHVAESFSYLMWAQATYNQEVSAYETYLDERVELFSQNYGLEVLEKFSEEQFEEHLQQKLFECDRLRKADPTGYGAAEAEARALYPDETASED